MCSESRIAGRATFTTVESSMIMNGPDETAASVHHFLFSRVTSRPVSRSPGDGEGVPQMTHRVTLRGRLSSGISYGQPAPGAGASAVSTWPVRGPANMLTGPFHTVAVINTVLPP